MPVRCSWPHSCSAPSPAASVAAAPDYSRLSTIEYLISIIHHSSAALSMHHITLAAAFLFTLPGVLLAQNPDSTNPKSAPAAASAGPAVPAVKSRQSMVFGLLVMEIGEG